MTVPLPLRKEAKNWLALNGHYDFVGTAKTLIADAFNKLKNKEYEFNNSVLKKLLADENRYDKFGIVDGRLFTDDEIEELRKATAESYKNEDNKEIDGNVIKDLDEHDNIVYNKDYYELFKNDVPEELKTQKKEVITKINNTLIKGFDRNGHLNSKKLFEECTIDELEELANNIKELRSYKSNISKNQIDKISKYTTTKTSKQFNKEYGYYRTELKNDKKKQL